jgi:hypothetical protein
VLNRRHPDAVTRLVVPVSVQAVQVPAGGRRRSHVVKEVREPGSPGPALANLNTAPSVTGIRLIFRVFTASVHALPQRVVRVATKPVPELHARRAAMFRGLRRLQAPARLPVAIAQVSTGDHNNSAALAPAAVSPVPVLASRVFQHGQHCVSFIRLDRRRAPAADSARSSHFFGWSRYQSSTGPIPCAREIFGV